MGTIQIKRGLSQNLPSSAAIAEILYTTDTRKFYIGNGENTPLTEFANANQLADYLAQKANVLHSHTKTNTSKKNIIVVDFDKLLITHSLLNKFLQTVSVFELMLNF